MAVIALYGYSRSCKIELRRLKQKAQFGERRCRGEFIDRFECQIGRMILGGISVGEPLV